jgi:predicted phage tail protein
MKTVRLHGELEEKFGSFFELEVSTAGEAIRALSANFPSFREHLLSSDRRGIGYHVIVDESAIDVTDLENPTGPNIQFVPAIMGAGSANTKIILGSALIAAGVIVSAASGGGLTGVGLTLVKVGAALTLSGVVQQLTPVPRAPNPSETPENTPSYTFDGPVNTTAQGQPIAVGYGRLIVGSAVISAGISVDELVSPQAAQDAKIRSYGYGGTLSI